MPSWHMIQNSIPESNFKVENATSEGFLNNIEYQRVDGEETVYFVEVCICGRKKHACRWR